ncbi:hypothetical protein D7030_01295 [Flavobacteriaceae bacterium AU392]|nr:hypothetical protein D1817_07750 [Flavobacteriaceae bacterium]RKM86514.1 hypothetical protein D7030_01295 [Flavobacteriaceae bacterium AU392]
MKNLLNLGKVLDKSEQKFINGGFSPNGECFTNEDCECPVNLCGDPFEDIQYVCFVGRCILE